MAITSGRRYAFDDVVVDTGNYRVYKAGDLRPIGPRAFDLLLDLLAHPGRVVSKEELFTRVWQGVAVTDNALPRAVKDLRKAIGDRARSPRYIETASRRGYRFIAEVDEMPESGSVSVLVLPFDDLSPSPSTHLTIGLVDELIARLGRINPYTLTVIGRASAAAAGAIDRPWPDLGRDLGVDYVVQGSVRRDERRAQVSIRIGRVADGEIVSTRPFDAEVDDAVGVESRLAASISAEVQVQLADRPSGPPARPVDPDAQAALLEGRHFLRQRTAAGVEQARSAFERAIALAPGFARAYVGLAQSHANYMMGTRLASEAKAQAHAAVAKALALDDRLAEAHAMLAVLQCADWQFAEAERSLRWAVALDPVDSNARHWLAMFPLVVSGRYEEALVELRRAKRLDPLSLIISADIGGVYLMTRQFDRAITQCTDSLRLDPHFARAHLYLGMARAALGRHGAAIVALETADRLDRTPWTRAWLGQGYGAAGRTSDAEALLNSLVSDLDVSEGESPFLVGVVHAGLGRVDEALAWFERAMETRSFWITTLGAFPAFDALRADARFGGLLARIRESASAGSGL